MVNRKFVADGHLIDSGILAKILTLIIEEGADYTIHEFKIGKTNLNPSHLDIEIHAPEDRVLEGVTQKLVQMGCYEKGVKEAHCIPAPKDACVPDDFYSTTNHRTEVFLKGEWREVVKQRMDGVIISGPDGPVCKKLRDVKKGDLIVCTAESVRVFPPQRERHTDLFGFMSGDVSSERSVDVAVAKIAEELRATREQGGKVVAVAGPVVIHTGGGPALAGLIRAGYIHGLLSGNAIAVHDLESQLYGTSLGVDLSTGRPTNEGHRNHMRTINKVNFYGSIAAAVEAGVFKAGVMYEIIKKGIPFCLAGSIRDDGPLPETETDMIRAQERYAEIIKGSNMALMLSSMLHSIGTGNMLPSWVKTVCVDINPAVVTKLSDRGSSQTIGIVSDVGLFLRALALRLGV